jgi:phosphoribosylamine-glycine ligase
VSSVVAAAGDPVAARLGAPITLPEPRPDVHIFHAGTRRRPDGTLVTAGGRVLSVTAVAASLADAQQASAAAARGVVFDGKQYRADIGWRELRRNARTA